MLKDFHFPQMKVFFSFSKFNLKECQYDGDTENCIYLEIKSILFVYLKHSNAC